jgi:hypothetical protein
VGRLLALVVTAIVALAWDHALLAGRDAERAQLIVQQRIAESQIEAELARLREALDQRSQRKPNPVGDFTPPPRHLRRD